MRERRATAQRLRERRDEAAGRATVARRLGVLLDAKHFQRWLAAEALDILVVDASATLSELSGGQYELTHDKGEFLIVDHSDADSRRPVKTLSGGETFQASLALALALSEHLSGLAAAGTARLDSIFLDEGFGSLDEATLDVVAATLENLAAKGDRMVGDRHPCPGPRRAGAAALHRVPHRRDRDRAAGAGVRFRRRPVGSGLRDCARPGPRARRRRPPA